MYVRIQIIEREGKYYFNMDFPDDLPKVMPKALPRTSVLVSRTKELSSDLTKNDQEILEKEFIVYDALYAYCKRAVARES